MNLKKLFMSRSTRREAVLQRGRLARQYWREKCLPPSNRRRMRKINYERIAEKSKLLFGIMWMTDIFHLVYAIDENFEAKNLVADTIYYGTEEIEELGLKASILLKGGVTVLTPLQWHGMLEIAYAGLAYHFDRVKALLPYSVEQLELIREQIGKLI